MYNRDQQFQKIIRSLLDRFGATRVASTIGGVSAQELTLAASGNLAAERRTALWALIQNQTTAARLAALETQPGGA